MSTQPRAVSVHALDGGGGEGLLADARVFEELDCRPICIATSVLPSEPLPASLVQRQLDAARRGGEVAAARTGFVKGKEQVALLGEFVSSAAKDRTVISWSGLDAETRTAMLEEVVPAARVVVVRASEMARGGDRDALGIDDLRAAAQDLRDRGARAVVVCGLIARGRVIDLLNDGGAEVLFDTAKIQATRVEGLPGAHAAALAAHIARGLTLRDATEAAQRYVGLRLRRGR